MKAQRYHRFLGMAIIAFLCLSILLVKGEKDLLLHKNQNTSWHWLTRFEFGPWSGWSHDGNSGCYIVCDLSETAKNHTNSWLISEYIDLQQANEVLVEFSFTIRQCPTGLPYCKQTFSVYELQSNGPVVSGITKKDIQSGMFNLVDTVNATHVWTPGSVPQINQANLTFSVNGRGVYLAFQDTGACLALMSVRLSYTYCPSLVNHGIVLKKIAAPQSSQHNITVNGTCSNGASPYPSNSPIVLTCLSSGQWVKDYEVTCLCTAGYELVGDTCTVCNSGFFKNSAGNDPCITCPSNSMSGPNRDYCPCKNGFYRAPQDATNDSCTAPPSEPRDINITVVTDTVVIVTWSHPVFNGGRADVKYDLQCSECSNMGSCSDNCLGAQFWPSKIDLKTTQATISNLDSAVLYNITVISKNGVSDQAGLSSLRFLHKTFSLTKETTTNPTTITFSVVTETIAIGNLTTEGSIAPEQGTQSSSNVSAAIGISVAVTFVICFVVGAIIIFLLWKSWRTKQIEQQSHQSSATQLSDLSRDGTPMKRGRSITTTTELIDIESTAELGNGKNSPAPAINFYDLNSNSEPNSRASNDWVPLKRLSRDTTELELTQKGCTTELQDEKSSPVPSFNIQESDSNSTPSSPSSTDWLPLKEKRGLPPINIKPPRAISPVLRPNNIRRKPSVPPLDLGDNASSNYLSPRKPPEGSEVYEDERSPSVNSWFPVEEVQFNV